MLRRFLTFAVLVVVAATSALAVPAVAPADGGEYRETEYRADVELRGSWTFHRKEAYGDRQVDEVTANLEFTAKASMEYVLFRNGELVTPERWAVPTVESTGSAVRKETRPKPGDNDVLETITTTCDGVANAALRTELRAAPGSADSAGMVVRLVSGVTVGVGSCGERVEGSPAIDNPYSPIGGDVFDKTIQMPHEVIGFGEITEFLSAGSSQKSPAVCPGKDAFTDECTFTWTATVKFVRTGGDVYDPAQDKPKPPPPPPPTPPIDPRADAISRAVAQYVVDNPTPIDPRADAIRRAVEQYGKNMYDDPRAQIISDAVAQYGRYVEMELGCTGGCAGTGVITAGGGAGGGSVPGGGGAKPRAFSAADRARKVVARVKFTVPAGKPRKIRVRIPAKARRALARSSRATMKVTLKARRGGPTSTRTLVVRRGR